MNSHIWDKLLTYQTIPKLASYVRPVKIAIYALNLKFISCIVQEFFIFEVISDAIFTPSLPYMLKNIAYLKRGILWNRQVVVRYTFYVLE